MCTKKMIGVDVPLT